MSMRNHHKFLGALAVAGIVAASGSAFTAANTVPDTLAGYGTSTITGATATSLKYTLNADGTQITDAALVFTEDLTGKTVKAGFGIATLTACTVGTYEPANPTATPPVVANTPVTCSGYTQSTADSASFNVSVNS